MSGRLATAIGKLPHVTPRAAFLTAAPVLLLPLVPAPWAWVALSVWLVLIALLVRVDLGATPRPGEIEVVRTLPEKLSIGAANPVTLTVRNASRYAATLTIRETPPVGFTGERVIGPITLAPHAEEEFALSFTPPGRGEFRFGDVGVRAIGPLGLAGRQLTIPPPRPAASSPTSPPSAGTRSLRAEVRSLTSASKPHGTPAWAPSSSRFASTRTVTRTARSTGRPQRAEARRSSDALRRSAARRS